MSSLVRIVLTSNGTAADFKSQCNLAPGGLDANQSFENYIGGLSGGNVPGASLAFQVGATKAYATFTFSSTGPTNGQTCTICGVTFTAVTSDATGDQFNINATPATVAANLASAINAAASMAGIVTASSSGAVTTLTAVVPGKMGNGLVCANVNLSNTVVASFAASAAVDGTAYSYNLGGG